MNRASSLRSRRRAATAPLPLFAWAARHATPLRPTAPAPRLLLLPDAPDADGQPRVALALPTLSTGRRAALVIFPTIAAALAALRTMEGVR